MSDVQVVKDNEAGLIGAVLRGGSKTFDSVSDIVKSDNFRTTAHADIWSAFSRLHERGLGIDVITVGDELERYNSKVGDGAREGRAFLSFLRSEGVPDNARSYAENVQDYSVKRNLEEIASRMAYYAKNGRRSADIILDVEKLFSEITLYSGKSAQHTVSFSQAVSEAYDRTDLAASGNVVGCETGFVDLDNILGAMYGGNLYVVGARPGQGKTSFLLSIAKHAAEKGKRVVIFSIEMMRYQVAQRIISMISGIPVDRIIKGKMLENEWALYTHAVEQAEHLPITINDMGAINIAEIRQEVRKQSALGKIDLIIVDYVQIAKPSESKERRDLDIGDITMGLKALAKEIDAPVLTASQLSRDLEKRGEKRPMLADLRESGSLENDSDVVMFIYRPDQYEKDTAKQNIAEIIVAKHRNGAVGSVDLVYRPQFTKFENAATKMFSPNQRTT